MNAYQNVYRETLHGERLCCGVAGHVYQQSDDPLSTKQNSILVTQVSVTAQAAVSSLDLLEAGIASWAARASTQLHHHNVYHPLLYLYVVFQTDQRTSPAQLSRHAAAALDSGSKGVPGRLDTALPGASHLARAKQRSPSGISISLWMEMGVRWRG